MAGCLCVIAVACAAGSPSSPSRPQPLSGRAPDETAITLYIVRRKWHIDVGFAATDLGEVAFAAKAPASANPGLLTSHAPGPLASMRAEFPRANYFFFGFGDRHYLLAQNHRVADLSGALWPGPALILLTALSNTPSAAFGGTWVAELRLSAVQARGIQRFIRDSIANPAPHASIADAAVRDARIAYVAPPYASLPDAPVPYAPVPYAKGPYDGSLYYAASARYSALHTCNTWAAEALRAGAVPVRSRAVIFAGQLWSQVQRLTHTSRSAPLSIPAPGSP